MVDGRINDRESSHLNRGWVVEEGGVGPEVLSKVRRNGGHEEGLKFDEAVDEIRMHAAIGEGSVTVRIARSEEGVERRLEGFLVQGPAGTAWSVSCTVASGRNPLLIRLTDHLDRKVELVGEDLVPEAVGRTGPELRLVRNGLLPSDGRVSTRACKGEGDGPCTNQSGCST